MGELYIVGTGGSISGGRWRGSLGPVNVWSQLTVAAHSRKVLGGGPPAASGTFDPTYSIAVDAMSPSTVQSIPSRSFSSPAMGEPGMLYYTGGMHSDYRGNEVDRIDLRNLTSTQITTTINHQPSVPPAGPGGGYSSSGSEYIHRQYGSTPNPADWQPYSHHSYTKCTWHPEWGFVEGNTGAQGDGTTTGADPNGSGSGYPQATAANNSALVTYNFAEGRYHNRLYPLPGSSGASDWNPHRQSIVYLDTSSQFTCYVKEIHALSTTVIDDFNFSIASLGGGGPTAWTPGQSGNGVIIKHLEGNKHLCLRIDYSTSGASISGVNLYHTLVLIELSPTSAARLITPPAGPFAGVTPSGDGNYTFAVDKNSRRVFWMVVSAGIAPRFYVSTFDALDVWTELSTSGLPSLTWQGNWLAAQARESLQFYNGHLFLLTPAQGPSDPGYTNGSMGFLRMKVDGGELLPAMAFNRFDYYAQDFRYSYSLSMTAQACKHTNWAYSQVTGKYYQCGGDISHSYSQSMASLTFDGTGRGYTFAETLNELTPAPVGKIRPAGTDDGFWFFVPTDSAWVAGRGKFVWQRGGEGISVRSSGPMQSAYATDAAAYADRWTTTPKYYVWDSASPSGFDGVMDGTDGWTQDNGGIVYQNVWEKTATSSRMGCFDPITGCAWRFYDSHVLARIDFQNKTVKIFNLTGWTSPDTGRFIFMDGVNPANEGQVVSDGTKEKFCWYDSGAGRWRTFGDFHWEHKAVWIDPATGYLYVVSPGTGYLWRYDTRGTHTLTGDGYVLPFGPVGKRIPLVGCYPPLNSRGGVYPPVVYGGEVKMNSRLFPFKGGLLWLSSNHHSGGDCGEPYYAFWRRLGYAGEWSVVTMPKEFAANTGAAKSVYSIDNDEIMMISQVGTDIETRQWYKYFWKIT